MSTAENSEDEYKVKKVQWLKDEDEKLRYNIFRSGIHSWSKIAEAIPGRTGKQCRERWHNHLDASIVKADWTAEEDGLIIAAQKRIGNHWAKISQMLPGRSDNAVKNRYHLISRKSTRLENRKANKKMIASKFKDSKVYNVVPSDTFSDTNIAPAPSICLYQNEQKEVKKDHTSNMYSVHTNEKTHGKCEIKAPADLFLSLNTCKTTDYSSTMYMDALSFFQMTGQAHCTVMQENVNEKQFHFVELPVKSIIPLAPSPIPIKQWRQQQYSNNFQFNSTMDDLHCVSVDSVEELEFDADCFSYNNNDSLDDEILIHSSTNVHYHQSLSF